MDVLIFGAGGVGLGLASVLVADGARVRIVGRPETARALQREGLRRSGWFGDFQAPAGSFRAADSLAGVAGAVFSEEKQCVVSESDALEAELSEEAKKAARAEREKLLREARNAPKTIDKIERALAVLEEDVAAIDARLLACGADVAAAQEVQREKDAKTEKQDLYMAEWERLEGVMEQAEAIIAAAEDA